MSQIEPWAEVQHERNLLIVHAPGKQALGDWITVKAKIEERAADIEVRIASATAPQSATAKWQISRPSLVFSPDRLNGYRPRGGTVLTPHPINKLNQARRLAAIGIRVPHTFDYTPDFVPDPGLFGQYAITKPAGRGRGINVTLVQARDLAARWTELTFGGAQRTLVQQYIEHSEDDLPTAYRVLTMCGSVLYSTRVQWAEKRRSLEEIAASDGVIATNSDAATAPAERLRVLWAEDKIIKLAEQASSAFPECPVLAVDIVREPATKLLYVLEVNPAGGVWHLSSAFSKKYYPADYVRALYQQFNALDRAATLLIDKTRAAAT